MSDFNYKEEIEKMQVSISKLIPRTPNVLLIDDDPNDICLVCRELQNFYCNVEVCHDPERVSELLKQKPFDIVFLDLIMPKVSGLEVMQSVVGLNPGTHFVLVTGYPTSTIVDETIRLGAVLVAKPITEKTLKLFLRRKDE